MKKVAVRWTKRQKRIVGRSHPGCCAQGGGCTKKHGSK
ncbi:MAG: hypothetical protein UV00_C0025G0003 [candidate division WWE3 bacterium GW2011_GWF1_42_14]|uniref:Uncharacterized protein n=2 Tax=Katanobacteria TaxID=422282 RepID=A0A0G1ARE0_UNCKA|nr:MAG: hypothetical protein UU92_C0022G0010 [candidate division WWE3 bacterium GW2011_GWA1_42_12]KKS33546.1 MAG: hypothetical protein UU97_C0027G0009 [candidate division WWE3 bacterium GW2011_GWD1_42_14]KKS36636.1 MAG: hypothetical protein UV00_C0025G0003 [candidate division WWE3 bacterium GW2011_GWF1_42_14]KKS39703.1 MAG: hypothetical protein UV03_C0023G0003 [candidate division WWE3 bacterium GW2011_GWE1_42_16]KKS65845.1 MAG: hypothetical protein UV35_C0031G0010 [candidate division WWE3 bacte